MEAAQDLNLLENHDKLYFQVLINYIEDNSTEHSGVNKELETGALKSFGEADDIIKKAAEKFLSSVPESNLVELEPEQQTDEFHIFVVDTINSVVVAKFGIIAIDYTNVTIH